MRPASFSIIKSLRLRAGALASFVVGIAIMPFLLAPLHTALVFGVATAVRNADISSLNAQIDQLPVDVDIVHTQLALSVFTAVRPKGIAVAGALGEWLHAAFPTFFYASTHVAPGVWISALLSRGGSLPGLYATRVLTEVILIVLGTWLLRIGMNPRRRRYLVRHEKFALSWCAAFGLYLQAQAIWSILRLMPSPREIESMGVGFLVRNFVGNATGQYEWLAYSAIPLALTFFLIILGLCLVPIVARFYKVIHAARATWSSRSQSTVAREKSGTWSNPVHFRHVLIGFGLMLVLAGFMPRSLFAKTNASFVQPEPRNSRERAPLVIRKTPPPPIEIKAVALQATPTALPTPTVPETNQVALLAATPASSTKPTPPAVTVAIQQPRAEMPLVQIVWSPARAEFVLLDRNGELFTVRGVNYNTHYTRLPREEHLSILRQNFKQMQQAGVNVITGYGTFDESTLTVAQEYGISVIMPFVPDLTGDYADPVYRERVKQQFGAFIKRYEGYPSLLMWNFDDEPIHNMKERLQRPPDQVQAFADFLLELARFGYERDRHHRPSWLKEPRDWYLDILDVSLRNVRQARPGSPSEKEILDPSRYVILARSAYGAPVDIQEWLPRLANKVERGLNMPFAVGEYGVLGVDPAERAFHLAEILKEARRESAIGTAVYTYRPFQPDPNDLTDPQIADQLKLVDDNGKPTDDAWARLSEVWLAQQAEERDGRRHSSIPLAVPAFQAVVEQWGGYASSGSIEENLVIKQFFVEGKKEGVPIAYMLRTTEAADQVEFMQVDSIVFNELGEYALSGAMLVEYLKNGGYAKFGAPVTNPRLMVIDGKQFEVQDFAKGWSLQVPR